MSPLTPLNGKLGHLLDSAEAAQRPPKVRGSRAKAESAAVVPRSEWIFCNHPFRFLRKRAVQAHICTQNFYTAQIPEIGVLQMAG